MTTDKYDLSEAMWPAYDRWRGDPGTMGVAPGVPATGRIFVSWVWGDRDWFRVATREVLVHCGVGEEGELEMGGEGLEGIMPPVPGRVIGELISCLF